MRIIIITFIITIIINIIMILIITIIMIFIIILCIAYLREQSCHQNSAICVGMFSVSRNTPFSIERK